MADKSAEDEKIVEGEEDLEDTDEEEDKVDEDEEKEKVPVRGKSNADFARTRIAIKGKKETKESDDEGEELTDKAQKLIDDEVKRRVAPIVSDLENKMLLRDYLGEHPEHRKYAGRAGKYMVAHPTLTVEDIFKILAPSVEPEEKEKAIDKANRGSIKGSTVRKGEEKTATTEADMKEVYKNVKRGNTKEALKSLGLK